MTDLQLIYTTLCNTTLFQTLVQSAKVTLVIFPFLCSILFDETGVSFTKRVNVFVSQKHLLQNNKGTVFTLLNTMSPYTTKTFQYLSFI